MTKLEKVICFLERCTSNVPDTCQDCAYDYKPAPDCWLALERDALELLKEQGEPHVLTLEEAEKAEYCVLEVRNGSLLQVVHDEAGGYFSPSLNNLQKLYYERLFYEDEHDDYNKRVRCWSALPSEEQRRAVKWDE